MTRLTENPDDFWEKVDAAGDAVLSGGRWALLALVVPHVGLMQPRGTTGIFDVIGMTDGIPTTRRANRIDIESLDWAVARDKVRVVRVGRPKLGDLEYRVLQVLHEPQGR